MTTCIDCGFNHVANLFIIDFDEDKYAVMECPNCGSDNVVKDSEAKEKGYETDPFGNMVESIEQIVEENQDDLDDD